MKKILLYLSIAFGIVVFQTSCNDFGDVNDDPEHLNQNNVDYKLMFTGVQTQMAGSDWDIWRNGCIYSANMMQHTTSADWQEGVFYTWNEGFNAAYWDGFYSGGRAAIRNIIEVIGKWNNNSAYKNEYQYSRIVKVYLFQRMTDLYGDVPYFDAGKAMSGNGYPKYDTQEAIYDDLLKELDEVNTALLNPSTENTIGSADLFYQGNPEKWRKFANSLMLRVAMRLTKIDVDKAKTWTAKAISNGLFVGIDDNAMLKRNDGVVSNDSGEPYGKVFSELDPAKFYISEYFMNSLKSTADPRIHLIATKCDDPTKAWSSANGFEYGNSSDLNSLIGLPIGYDLKDGSSWNLKNALGYPGDNAWRSHYAVVNRKTYSRPDAPSMFVTYAENCLLLADAAARGIISGGTATSKEYFTTGVKAAMQQFSSYSAASTEYNIYLSSANVDAYVASRLAEFDANPIKEINWQYYITTFCDEYETFANWRRTGYPELKSVYSAPYNRPAYPNRVGTEIPRRFTYPVNESQVNTANYNEAVNRLSNGDKMDSRVWWDK